VRETSKSDLIVHFKCNTANCKRKITLAVSASYEFALYADMPHNHPCIELRIGSNGLFKSCKFFAEKHVEKYGDTDQIELDAEERRRKEARKVNLEDLDN
jgi:hypothetical protein